MTVRGAERMLTFEKDVRPIVKEHCTHCHGEEEKPEGGVDLRLRRFMDLKLDSGSHVVVPGQPAQSELVRLIKNGEMPKKGKQVSEEELAIIEQWIAQGAKTARPEPLVLAPGPMISDDDREYWAFQPVKPSAVPRQVDAKQVRTPVDAFLLKSMADKGLTFAPEADRRTLIRRVSLDLTGLLPTPEEVDSFVNDKSPLAYEQLVERLLASKNYGERWARHWLDVAGYADSNGYSEADSLRPQAWRYRDYVIRAMNADKPWDEFIQEQLAGDELAGATHADYQQAVLDPHRTDQLIATAFLRMAPDGTGDVNDDAKLAKNQVIAEQIKVMTSSLMGMTVACAQCHDHRYDPITQADYYRLRAVFDPAYNWEAWRAPAQRLYSLYSPEERAQAAAVEVKAKEIEVEARAMSKKFLDEIFEVEIKKVPEAEQAAFRIARDTPKEKHTPEQKTLIKKYPSALATYSLNLYDQKKQNIVDAKMAEAKKLRDTKPVEGFVMALTEVKGQVPASKLFNRGDHEQPKQALTPGELSILASPQIEPFKPVPVSSGSSGRRLAYSQWLTSGKHPLTARVLVNRFWMNHMGRGIVNTPGDFGRQGELPTHPELLDYLATEFVKSGWQLKPLHRLILLSSAYRQSTVNDASMHADPENKLYARFKLRRIDAETLRDSLLAATGTLVQASYGPPSGIGRDPQGRVVTGIDKGTISLNKVDPGGADDFRRSIYVQVRRSKPVTVLDTFDAPVMTPNCELRAQTTVAPQSLLLMNDTFVLDSSLRLADLLQAQLPGNRAAQIQRAWELLFGKPATQADVTRGIAYLDVQTQALTQYHHDTQHPKGVVPNPPQEAMASLCQILCSSNRFLYVE
ncbi:PSD1 and planctomycete cytochrome C domain-containing protein [Prosthecobacter sp.]|uniref:PSD1 and planctomycete cytochrome C domain-containing protein n=1 Tax=Prosthecobacter sp. TaxID=1965333 RepID=UPI0024886A3C|nr:PSD1 and planctomycete cytochrome C domain-containing protein [Prosthecobacter sp.]MDI1313953.1 PSD1 and planctomycete cytochrome C domain-containing protein [Prosthecobacter sp.]